MSNPDTRKALAERCAKWRAYGIEYRWTEELMDFLRDVQLALAAAPAPQAGPTWWRCERCGAYGTERFDWHRNDLGNVCQGTVIPVPAVAVGTEGPGAVSVVTEMCALAIHLRDIGAPGESQDLQAMADRVQFPASRPDVEAHAFVEALEWWMSLGGGVLSDHYRKLAKAEAERRYPSPPRDGQEDTK